MKRSPSPDKLHCATISGKLPTSLYSFRENPPTIHIIFQKHFVYSLKLSKDLCIRWQITVKPDL